MAITITGGAGGDGCGGVWQVLRGVGAPAYSSGRGSGARRGVAAENAACRVSERGGEEQMRDVSERVSDRVFVVCVFKISVSVA